MAGTLTISTLSDGTNSTSSTNCIKGSAKGWCRFTGSTATIENSFNVSSITRNSAGSYWVNWTTAMSSTTYALAATAGWRSVICPDNFETGRVLVVTSENYSALADRIYISVIAYQ